MRASRQGVRIGAGADPPQASPLSAQTSIFFVSRKAWWPSDRRDVRRGAVIVLDCGGVGCIHSARGAAGACSRLVGGLVFFFATGLIEVMLQLLLRFAPALADSRHLLRRGCSTLVVLRRGFPRILVGIVAHRSIVPLGKLPRKTTHGIDASRVADSRGLQCNLLARG